MTTAMMSSDFRVDPNRSTYARGFFHSRTASTMFPKDIEALPARIVGSRRLSETQACNARIEVAVGAAKRSNCQVSLATLESRSQPALTEVNHGVDLTEILYILGDVHAS